MQTPNRLNELNRNLARSTRRLASFFDRLEAARASGKLDGFLSRHERVTRNRKGSKR